MAPTVFAMLCKASGLSHKEAAEFLDVRVDTINRWYTGRKSPPDEVLLALINCSELADELLDRATGRLVDDVIEKGVPDEEEIEEYFQPVQLGISVSEEQAAEANLPPLAVQKAFVARMIIWIATTGGSCEIVPLLGKDRGIYGGIWDSILEEGRQQEAEETFALFEGHPGLAKMN